ncbi:MAG TPA: glycosyltransferase family 2 protein [Lacipirellulaceae bacterium]|nr:glycosyltransferase family 2 protein [Lacipirellulaceae bacterium]
MYANPTVSIIISAYNRPRVIAFAIKSVLASDFEDWETIVVGDGCNAETEEAVRAFTDARIRFHNLPSNTGHQSAPHNKGVELARGEFVLFLNQDDMYFPDHISKRVAFMRATGADLSWSPILLLQHCGLEKGPVDVEKDVLTLDGAVADGRFNPRSFIISSCWAVRRETCHEVGPWLLPNKTRLSPSQEWLYRAHIQGRRMEYHRHVSVICIHSGARRSSYLSARSFEHERAWSWLIAGPIERLNLMHCVAVHEASDLVLTRALLAGRVHPRRTLVENVLHKLGVHPHSTQRYFEGLAKGEWVGGHMRFTSSKPPELPLKGHLPAGSGAAEDFLGRGWHSGEDHGRWTAAEIAEIFFTAPAQADDTGKLVLEVCGHTLRAGDKVTFTLNGGAPITKAIGGADEVTAIALPGPGTFHLTIGIEKPASPQSLGLSGDRRVVGYWLSWLRIAPVLAPAKAQAQRCRID